jgi:cytochrome c oxidase subunit 2
MAPVDIGQSMLSPAGPQTSSIHALWLVMLWTASIVFLVVLAFLTAALIRGVRRRDSSLAVPAEHVLNRSVGAAVAGTVVVLVGLLLFSLVVGRRVASLHASSAVTIAITGHQWWWQIEYEDAVPDRRVLTADEVHIPTNRPIVFKVTSADVIHSFWVPNLQGKRDLIPGYTTAIWMEADRPGVFSGQCAEFCGLQHAHMSLDVVAEPEPDFERWLDAMRQPARDPQTDVERRGQNIFLDARCGTCHTVRGTNAHGQIAPDLTHIAARRRIGAGTLSNTPDHLRAWVENAQASKPGNQMPPNPLAPSESEALVAYLDTLR